MAKKKPTPEVQNLTPRQELFVREYLKDLNATQAYIRAGYKEKGARANAARMIANDNISKKIRDLQSAQATKLEINAERVLKEIARAAFSDIGQIIDFSGEEPRLKPASAISEDARRTISSIKVKRYTEGHGDEAKPVEVLEFKLWSKPQALQDLAKYLRMLADPVDAIEALLLKLPYEIAVPIREELIKNLDPSKAGEVAETSKLATADTEEPS